MISLMSDEGRVRYKVYEFVIDTAADLVDVPTDVSVGSKVYCIEDSTVYMLNNAGEYVEVSFSSGGGSGDVESYTQLKNKPAINGITLLGNKTSEDLEITNIQLVSELPDEPVNNTLYIVPNTEDNIEEFYIYVNDEFHEIESGMECIFLVDELPTDKVNGALYVVKGNSSANPPTNDRIYFYDNNSLYEIKPRSESVFLVSELPTTKVHNSLYIVKGDSEVTPPTIDKLYFYSNSSLYSIDASIIDYKSNIRLLNKPQIDEHELMGLNNTHESLELISEKDFVTAPTSKTDGMEFILPAGTPDNPIEITEINDSDEVKYADNYTSSNNHINTNFDELYRLVRGKMQILFETELPDPPAINTMYFVDTEVPNVYHCWLVDSVGTVKDGGTTNIDLSDYVMKTVKVGSNALNSNVTTAMLNGDLKDYTTEIKNKTVNADNNTLTNIQTSNFKNGVIKTSVPTTPTDTELLTAKAVDEAKQDKLSAGSEIATASDDTIVSNVDLSNKKVFPLSALSIWNYIKGKVTGAISGLLTENLGTSKALMSDGNGKIAVSEVTSDELAHLIGVVDDLKITSASGSNAMTYTNTTYTSVTEYDSNVPRRAIKFGGMCQLSFQSKGTIAAGSANWLTIGNVKTGYRPKQDTPIIVQIFNNGTNEAAGGTIKTNGDVKIWVNTKVAGSNYQVRCNAIYPV